MPVASAETKPRLEVIVPELEVIVPVTRDSTQAVVASVSQAEHSDMLAQPPDHDIIARNVGLFRVLRNKLAYLAIATQLRNVGISAETDCNNTELYDINTV